MSRVCDFSFLLTQSTFCFSVVRQHSCFKDVLILVKMRSLSFFLLALFGAVVSQKSSETQNRSASSTEQSNTTRIVYPSEDTNKNRRPTHVSSEVQTIFNSVIRNGRRRNSNASYHLRQFFCSTDNLSPGKNPNSSELLANLA